MKRWRTFGLLARDEVRGRELFRFALFVVVDRFASLHPLPRILRPDEIHEHVSTLTLQYMRWKVSLWYVPGSRALV